MYQRQQGVFLFKMFGFGNQTTKVTITDILQAAVEVQQLNNDIHTDEEGFWGLMCLSLEIPNNRNNRKRLRRAYKLNESAFTFSEQPVLKDTQKSPIQVTCPSCRSLITGPRP
ncbi:uncharacterized protein LOC144007027 [Festucalex cinctus]